MTSYKLALAALLSAQVSSARKVSTKSHLRQAETLAEDDIFFHRKLQADQPLSIAITDAIAEKQRPILDLIQDHQHQPSSKSGKSGKSTQQIELLTMRVNTLEKELDELEELTNLHPLDPSCGDNAERIDELAAGLPEGCKMDHFGSSDITYRLVCDKPGTYNLHLPDMCSASALLVGGGGSGGNSPEGGSLLQLSGGGGAGGIVQVRDTSFGDGYYLVSVGQGGVGNPDATRGTGGDTTLELKQKLSLTETEYPGQELRAFGGGRGGGVFLIPDREFPCSFPRSGGSGGGGTPYIEGACNYNSQQSGGLSIGDNQGNSGGDGSDFCAGGGGGAGEKGDDGATNIEFLGDCALDQGGDGVYLGEVFGLDYGLPGGWFGGGGNPSASEVNRTLGGGGTRGILGVDYTVKNGVANTGGGGMGCEGSQILAITNMTCNIAELPGTPGVWDSWGGDGGSGILMIVFDVCPCNNNGN